MVYVLCEQERENPTLTEWDRFAHREYIRLSMEEDVEDASNGSAEVWDESLEAPFRHHLCKLKYVVYNPILLCIYNSEIEAFSNSGWA